MYTDGIKVDLTEEEIKEAIDWGAKNKDSFWKVIKPYLFGKWGISEEFGVILTKSFYLASLGARSARNYKSPEESDIGVVLIDDTLHVMINTYGNEPEFYKGYQIVLKQGERVIHPVKIESRKQAGPTVGFLNTPYYRGDVTGLFRYSEIDFRAKTTIILVKDEGESRFEVDFSEYK